MTSDYENAAEMDIRPTRAPLWRRLSLVWLVPVLALLVSLFVAWQDYASRGVLIDLKFQNASGIVAGETVLKYRDVTVGKVEKVSFSEGLSNVIVSTRVDANVAPYLDAEAQFWVVRPDVTVRGITGLDTVLGGVYIEGIWDGEATVAQTQFDGLDDAPVNRTGQTGTSILLRAKDGHALAEGAPILHKGIQVGVLDTPRLSFDGSDVIVEAFIKAPYDRRITSTTRFWDASGFSVNLNAAGVSLDVNSLASLIEGGIAFDTVVSGGSPIREGKVVDLFLDEQAARSSLFATPNQEVLNLSILFDGTVKGLTAGADVRFQGLRIGEVTSLNAMVITQGERQSVQLQTNLAIEPSRLGLGETATPEQALSFLENQVAQGLRARLATGNILSGSLQVELVRVADAPAATITTQPEQLPVLPTTASEIADVAATAEGVLNRINDLPVEELMNGAIDMMDSIEQLAKDDAIRQTPQHLNALLADAQTLVLSDDVQSIPKDLRDLVANTQSLLSADAGQIATDIRTILADLNGLVTQVDDAALVGKFSDTLTLANTAITNIETATADLPQVTADVQAIIAKANALELEQLVANANQSLAHVNALLGSDETADLPRAATVALDELQQFLAEIRQGGAIENVNAALASASQAAQAFEQSVADLPALSQQAKRLVSQTQAVVESYGDRSRFSAETLGTLRDIQSAADAVTALARAIQRNPSSLLTGR